MGRIRIKSDDGAVYEKGSVIEVADFIESYCECTNDKSLIDWLYRVPIPSAVDFIAKAWGIEYDFV